MSEIIAAIIAIVLALFGFCPSAVECGACGAHVSEWHYVEAVDGAPVAVCGECYENYVENTSYKPACVKCGQEIDGMAFGTSEGTFCAGCYEG